MKKLFSITTGLALCALMFAQAATADVTVQRLRKMDGLGGIAATQSIETQSIRGNKTTMDTESTTKIKIGFINKDMTTNQTSITDVDEGFMYALDSKSKTYMKISLTDMGSEDEVAVESVSSDEEMDSSESNMKVIRSEVSVKDTKEKKTINEFPCNKYLITWIMEMENTETKERATNTMEVELWNTPLSKKVAALDKAERKYNAAYWKKLGIDTPMSSTQQVLLSLASGATDKDAKTLGRELAKVKGYSIVISTNWKMDKKETAAAKEETPGNDNPMGRLGGFLNKLTDNSKSGSESDQQESNLMRTYVEIKSISTSKIPNAKFKVPADYTETEH